MESTQPWEATARRSATYDARAIEERWGRFWEEERVYAFPSTEYGAYTLIGDP